MKIDELANKIKDIRKLDWVEDAFYEDDCAPEGTLTIQVCIKEDQIIPICKELGFNTEDWDEQKFI